MQYKHWSQGGRDLVYKIGACAQASGIKNALFTLICGNIFIQYWLASDGPEGLGDAALFGPVSGCHSGLLLWPCVLSMLYPVAALCVLLWRGVPSWCGRLSFVVKMGHF